MLFNKIGVYYNSKAIARKIHNGPGITTTGLNAGQIATLKANFAKDLNIDERIAKFKDQLENECVYRIPLRYFTHLGKINFPVKTKRYLETEMKKLFESRKVLAAGTAIPAPNAKTIFTKAPLVQYEQHSPFTFCLKLLQQKR